MNKKGSIKFIVETALIAGLYVILTWIFAPISFGAIQFRLSEVLILLVVFNHKYAVSLILGCFIANLTSPLGVYDILFGTMATTLAIIVMMRFNNIWIAAIFPVLFNGFIISIELGIVYNMFDPAGFWYNVLTICLGEAGVLYLVGIPLMFLINRNRALSELLELKGENKNEAE